MADTIQQYVEDKAICSNAYVALVESSIWNEVRMERDKLLAESDWTVLPDSPIADKTAWQTYRQELRDITNGLTTVEQVEAVEFPTKPGA